MFKRSKPRQAVANESLVTIRADIEQIKKLAEIEAISAAQAEKGIAAGGMLVKIPARLVTDFQANQTPAESSPSEIEELAQRINNAGLNTPARLLLGAGRPLSFVGSQFLLALQPIAGLSFGKDEAVGRYSRLLEDRANIDSLLAQLEQKEAGR